MSFVLCVTLFLVTSLLQFFILSMALPVVVCFAVLFVVSLIRRLIYRFVLGVAFRNGLVAWFVI